VARPPDAKKQPDPWSLEALKEKPTLLWEVVGGGVLVLGMVGFLLTRGRKRVTMEAREALPMAPPPPAALPSAPAFHAPQSMPSPMEPSRIPALMPSRTELLLKQLQDSGKTNPEAWAGILRGWLAEEDAGG